MARQYSFRRSIASPGAVTLLQIQAPASRSIVIVRAWIGQATSTTSAQNAVQIVRKSSAATVTAAVIANDVRPIDSGDSASTVQVGTTATGYLGTAEGTDSDVLYDDGYNVLNGWLYLPVPEERIIVPGGGIIAIKFPAAPAALTYKVGIIFAEGAGT